MMYVLKLFLLFLSIFLTTSCDNVSSLITERQIILSLVRNLSLPDSLKLGWNMSHSTPCLWEGIQCDQRDRVIGFSLPGRGISGQLGQQIGQLKFLEKIDLSYNKLSGVIPLELVNCSKLMHLELSGNNFTEELPRNLENLIHLKTFKVYGNSISGKFPESLFSIPQLNMVNLGSNNFHGTISPTFGFNITLENLDLSMNMFTGDIPQNLCYEKHLKSLDLSRNQLQGSIPSNLGRCSTLRRLVLAHNNLTGVLPEFTNSQELTFLVIAANNLNGTIPSSLGRCRNLTLLDVSNNKLRASLLHELGNLVELQVLNVSHNHLQGRVPSEISKCTKLFSLDLGNNLFNGSIPRSLRNLTQMSTLILSENKFSGEIPDFLSGLKMLMELQLGGNLLQGSIPSALGKLQYLNYALNLSNNRLTGELPKELSNFTVLQRLDISHNNLTGTFPSWLYESRSLLEFNASYNQFEGHIPQDFERFPASSFLGNPGLCFQYSYNGTVNLPTCKEKVVPKSTTRRIAPIVMIIIIGSSLVLAVIILLSIYYREHIRDALASSLFAVIRCPRANNQASIVELMGNSIEERMMKGNNAYQDNLSNCWFMVYNEIYFSHKRLMKATQDMNAKFVIARGAHGTVYKARLDNQLFAVKKFDFTGQNGTSKSMHREIQTVGQIRHRNLVKLCHFWFRKDYGLIVYEYMSNGSLYQVLHEIYPPPILNWDVRYNIALGTAEGLAYLHSDNVPAVVHQDIKPHNILLDLDMEPKISDFGISKYMDQTTASIYTITAIGTVGYIAPEVAYTMMKTAASDVYSYGIVLLELITRKQVMDPSFPESMNILNWVHSICRKTGRANDVVDFRLAKEFTNQTVRKEVFEVLVVALWCTEKVASKRPTMKEVVSRLQNFRRSRQENSFWSSDLTYWERLHKYGEPSSNRGNHPSS